MSYTRRGAIVWAVLMAKFYLFLDVDGVLHRFELQIHGRPKGTPITLGRILDYGCDAILTSPPLSRLPLLEQVIRPYLDRLQIVVSSSWRLYPESYDHLLTAMSPDVRDCVVGRTPSDIGGGRPIEISTWLADHGEPGSQVIAIDDNLTEWWADLPDGSVFIGTDFAVGFSDLDGRVLTKLLADGWDGRGKGVQILTNNTVKQMVAEGCEFDAVPYEWPEPEQ